MSWGMGIHIITDEQVQKALARGLPKVTVRTRVVKLGWDPERAVTAPADPSCKVKGLPWRIDIYTLTEKQMEKVRKNGISKTTLRKRLCEPPFWKLEDAISAPPRGYKKREELRCESLSGEEQLNKLKKA